MYCLYNGEYGEHDLTIIQSIDTNLKLQQEQYPAYIGAIIGDFIVQKVEYDWGKRTQVATIKCSKCGEMTQVSHFGEWRRGKRQSTFCKCCKKITKERHLLERNRKQIEEKERKQKEQDDLHKAKVKLPIKVNGDSEYGMALEKKVFELFLSQGWDVVRTPDSGDYGVDIIVDEHNGHKLAVQVKWSNHPTGVDAIQQVYAGGRFYDCDKFAVVAWNGYTANAKIIASKLGIYLASKNFLYPADMERYSNGLLPTQRLSVTIGTKRLITDRKIVQYTIDGFTGNGKEICQHFGVSRNTIYSRMTAHGLTFEEAVKYVPKSKTLYRIGDEDGTILDHCKRYGISMAAVNYRIQQKGMTVEDAITLPTRPGYRRPPKGGFEVE